MEGNQNNDDSSHYEISLTAGQAFIAFILLLFSLAAAFAFGVIVGKGQFDDSLAAAAATESSRRETAQESRIVDLGAETRDRERPVTSANPPVIIEEARRPASASSATETAAVPLIEPLTAAEAVPHFAQILSTADAKAAEALAAKLIDAGFTTAYVERTNSPRGVVHRVRVRFPSEMDARSAVEKLKRFAAGEIWIASQSAHR